MQKDFFEIFSIRILTLFFLLGMNANEFIMCGFSGRIANWAGVFESVVLVQAFFEFHFNFLYLVVNLFSSLFVLFSRVSIL